MRLRAFRIRAAMALAPTLFLIAAHADDRPARQNSDFRPAAQAGAFPMVTTGVIVKIKNTTIGDDGSIVTDLRLCSTGHGNNSYQVDNVTTTVAVASPGGSTPITPPIAAACQGCHDDKATASHVLSNTTSPGEACVACHGNAAEFAVDKVHAQQQ